MATSGGDRPRPGRAAKVTPWRLRAGAVVHAHDTHASPGIEGRRGPPLGSPRGCGAVRGLQSGRGYCTETVAPT